MWEIQNQTLPRRNPARFSENYGTVSVKTNYRSYRDYLQSFNESKCKEDQESISSVDSGISSFQLSESKSMNSSSSSINSDLSIGSQARKNETENSKKSFGSYKEFLENYNNKKFGPVKPTLPSKKIVKSEIFIQVGGEKNENDNFEINDSKSKLINVDVVDGEKIINSKPPVNGFKIDKSKPEDPFKRVNGYSNGKTVEAIKKFNSLSKKEEINNETLSKIKSRKSVVKPEVVPERSSFINGRTSPYNIQENKTVETRNIANENTNNYVIEQNNSNNYNQNLKSINSTAEDNFLKKMNMKNENLSMNGKFPKKIDSKITNGKPVVPEKGLHLMSNGHSKISSNLKNISEKLNKINERYINDQINKRNSKATPDSSPVSTSELLSEDETESNVPDVESPATTQETEALIDVAIPPPPPPPPPMENLELKTNYVPKKWGAIKTEVRTESSKPKETNQAAMNLAKILIESRKLRKTKSTDDNLESHNIDDFENHKNTPAIAQYKTNIKPAYRISSSTKLEESLVDRPCNNVTPSIMNHSHIVNGYHENKETIHETTPSPPKKIDSQPLKPAFNSQSSNRINVSLKRTMSGPKIEYSSTILENNAKTVIPTTDKNAKIEKNDPNVKKMVYNTYRGLLGAYNPKANDIIATLPKNMVREDKGVSRQLESIASQAPPPPPPGSAGVLPSTRIQSEIAPRNSEPPLVVQNAMMTKDKKPFTYTPGGIDLTEIRSPRMARRLEKNAASEGVQPHPQAMHNQSTGPLPPSALAAMQPAMPVQVFPNGQIPQLSRGGAPPPPPPPVHNAGPPMPPPMQTNSVNKQTNRKSAVSPIPQNYERPDMTKIIPENPMSLLRKSPGPVVKQDPILNRDNYVNSGLNPLSNQAPQAHISNQQPQSPEIVKPRPQLGTVINSAPPTQNNVSTPPGTLKRQQQPFENRIQTPPSQPSPPPFVIQKQRSQSTPESPVKVKSPPPPLQRQPQSPESPGSPKVNLNKAPTPWLNQKAQQKDIPPWAVHEQENDLEENAGGVRVIPGQQPSSQLPGGTRIMPMQQPSNILPGGSRIMPVQQASSVLPGGARIIPINPTQQTVQSSSTPMYNNVVNINDPPKVYQQGKQNQTHNQNRVQQIPKVDSGERIIPIQIEGASNNNSNNSQRQQRPYVQKISGAPPPIECRPAYNRQQSQSNSFKVLQKMTNTDVDVDNEPAVDCSPRTAQQFQQRHPPVEQMRQMKMNDGDQDFVSRFKQGDEQNSSLHNEVDPRYRGSAIPSKAFKLLQNMTDSPDAHSTSPPVHHSQPTHRLHNQPQVQYQANQKPQVQQQVHYQQPQQQYQPQTQTRERTIPIQIEGNNVPKKYVPPSEQKVPEPKKYTGSAIPSRSFKILQAMTAPENCAEAEADNENYSNDPSSYEYWGANPKFPVPFLYPFEPECYNQRKSASPPSVTLRKKRVTKSPNRRRSFPYYQPQENDYSSEYECDKRLLNNRGSKPSNINDQNMKGHQSMPCGTPVPFWPYYPPPYPFNPNYEYEGTEGGNFPFPYPPMWDPYGYYAYYYGPYLPHGRPAFSPYLFGSPYAKDLDDTPQFSSGDESNRILQNSNELRQEKMYNNSQQNNDLIDNKIENNSSPDSNDTRKNQENSIERNVYEENIKTNRGESSDSCEDSDSSSDYDNEQNYRTHLLSKIPSVTNINVYKEEMLENELESNKNEVEYFEVNNEDCGPQLLSTIDELSERTDITDSKQLFKGQSVCSDDDQATLAHSDESGDEEKDNNCDILVTVSIPLKVRHSVSNNRKESVITQVGNSEIKEEIDSNCEQTNELYTSFTFRSPSREKSPNKGKNTNLSNTTQQTGVEVKTDYVTQDSFISCEHQELETDSSVKVVNVETTAVTETITISPKRIYDDEIKEENTENGKEEETDWWGKISDNDIKEKVIIGEEITNNEREERDKTQESVPDIVDNTDEEKEIDFWAEIIGGNDDEFSCKRNQKISSETMDDTFAEQTSEHSINSTSCSSSNKSEEDVEKNKLDDSQQENSLVENNNYNFCESRDTISPEIKNEVKDESEEYIDAATAEGVVMYTVTNNIKQNIFQSISDNPKNDISVSSSDKNENESEIRVSIKDRIRAFENIQNLDCKQKKNSDEEEVKTSVKEKVSAFEENNTFLRVDECNSARRSISRKNSELSEMEEEEIDSGVTSDLSKHVSEPEQEQEFPNLKKLNKYQRASTHSRLFKLLKDEIEAEEEAERLNLMSLQSKDNNINNNIYINRDQLDLPLKKNITDSESGINSPISPTINEGLINELVQSLLMRKQANVLKKIPMEKIQAAAVKILKEDGEIVQSSPEDIACFLSPVTNCTADSTAIHTPQEFYSNTAEYMQYYNSWEEANLAYDLSYDILPSKAFKYIQEHTALNKTASTITASVNAKCPRVLSSKNVPFNPSFDQTETNSPSSTPTQQIEAARAS